MQIWMGATENWKSLNWFYADTKLIWENFYWNVQNDVDTEDPLLRITDELAGFKPETWKTCILAEVYQKNTCSLRIAPTVQ